MNLDTSRHSLTCQAPVVIDPNALNSFAASTAANFLDLQAHTVQTESELSELRQAHSALGEALADLRGFCEFVSQRPGSTLADWDNYKRVSGRMAASMPPEGAVPF